VVDQGAGISEEDLPKVFGKFQQVGGHRKGGTGLGLAITQAFVSQHRGKIWADRFDLDEFPGVLALVAEHMKVPMDEVQVLGPAGEEPK
jgi:signal transduction histidine kinase